MKNLNMINKKNESNKIEENLKNIKNIYLVMSGKGGVGKSTVASIIASCLLLKGNKIGILDCDFHGPSISFLFGLKEDIKLNISNENKLLPVTVEENLKLMSISFLLESSDQPIIWRSPMKINALRQFLEDVEWGNLDYLIIDLPPGTGDDILNVIQMIKNISGAIVVTIPQDVALLSVRKSLSFVKKTNINLIGIISNMDGMICPKCNEKIEIFNSNKIKETLVDYQTKIIGTIPIDPNLSKAEENGNILSFIKENPSYINNLNSVLELLK